MLSCFMLIIGLVIVCCPHYFTTADADWFVVFVYSQSKENHEKYLLEYWMDNWTVSDVTGHAGVIGQYLANAIISDKSKRR